MKILCYSKVVALLVSASLLTGFAVVPAVAQPRPAGPRPAGPRPLSTKSASSAENVVIKSISGLKSNERLRTPDYKTSSPESQTRAKNWGCISVEYETSEDWTDELEFRYFVLVKDTASNKYLLFSKTVAYIEIAKGKHLSTVFVRPNTLQRYGEMERAAVEVWEKGQRVAMASIPPVEGQPWWQVAVVTGQVKVMDNMLMNRAESPFAYVAYENYETIKPK
jgi:hypothetical protein